MDFNHVNHFDHYITLPVYSLRNCPGVIDDDFRMIDFLNDNFYADLFKDSSYADMAIRDHSWIQDDGFRLFATFVASDVDYIESDDEIVSWIDCFLILGDYLIYIDDSIILNKSIRYSLDCFSSRCYHSED